MAFSGALATKKKAELQQIAEALGLDLQGTREEVHQRIKRHLDENQSQLLSEPLFAGLYGRKARASSKPPISSGEQDTKPAKIFPDPRPLQPVPETPAADLRDVSTMLKSPAGFSLFRSPSGPAVMDASTPAYEPSPLTQFTPEVIPEEFTDESGQSPSALQRLSAFIPRSASPTKMMEAVVPTALAPQAEQLVEYVREQQIVAVWHSTGILGKTQLFLSNARTIWMLITAFELLFVLYTVIPWKTKQVNIVPRGADDRSSIPPLLLFYPPPRIFQTLPFWRVLYHWALPSVFAPWIAGWLISFASSPDSERARIAAIEHAHSVASISNPGSPLPMRRAITPAGEEALLNLAPNGELMQVEVEGGRSLNAPGQDNTAVRAFDPLTASIIRLGAQIAYPYAYLETDVVGIDVLGPRWRILSASVIAALAFSEAISHRRA